MLATLGVLGFIAPAALSDEFSKTRISPNGVEVPIDGEYRQWLREQTILGGILTGAAALGVAHNTTRIAAELPAPVQRLLALDKPAMYSVLGISVLLGTALIEARVLADK